MIMSAHFIENGRSEIVVTYKHEESGEIRQIPYWNVTYAKKKARALHEEGYLGVKVSKIAEEVLYIPALES